MKTFLLTLVVDLALCAFSLGADPKDAAVRVSRTVGNTTYAGSGTVIASEDGHSLILTNAHVVEDGNGRLAITHGETNYAAKRIAGSTVRWTAPNMIEVEGPDLAVLEIAAELPAVTIATTFPEAGEALTVWGFGGGSLREQKGTLTVESWPNALAATMPPVQGNSGAGMFNSKGELVGVVWGGSRTTLAVRLDVMTRWTVGACASRPTLFPRFRAVIGGVASALAPRPMPAAAAKPQQAPSPKATPAPAPKPKESPKMATVPAPKTVPAAPTTPPVMAPQCVGGQCSQAPRYRQRGVILSFGIFRR